jgi:hypothetical protein
MSVTCVISRASDTSCPVWRLQDLYLHVKHLYLVCMAAFIPDFHSSVVY